MQRPAHSDEPTSEPTSRVAWVRRFGADPIACSTLQPGLWTCETPAGYVAFARAFGLSLALGPPVCAPSDKRALMTRFIETERGRAAFLYLQRDDALLARDLSGAHMCGIGVDKIVPLDGDADIARSARVHGAEKKAARARFDLVEVNARDVDRSRIEAITRDYLSRSAVPVEMRFLNRPLAFDDDLSRMFLLTLDSRVFGYAVIDPWFRGEGRPAGWLLNLIRFEQTRVWGVYYAAVVRLAKLLRAEGAGALSLGYCPLVDVDTADDCSRALAPQLRFMERRFAQVTYLARLQEMKEAFAGHTVQRYVVTPSAIAPLSLLALVRASGVPLGWMLGPQLFRSLGRTPGTSPGSTRKTPGTSPGDTYAIDQRSSQATAKKLAPSV